MRHDALRAGLGSLRASPRRRYRLRVEGRSYTPYSGLMKWAPLCRAGVRLRHVYLGAQRLPVDGTLRLASRDGADARAKGRGSSRAVPPGCGERRRPPPRRCGHRRVVHAERARSRTVSGAHVRVGAARGDRRTTTRLGRVTARWCIREIRRRRCARRGARRDAGDPGGRRRLAGRVRRLLLRTGAARGRYRSYAFATTIRSRRGCIWIPHGGAIALKEERSHG